MPRFNGAFFDANEIHDLENGLAFDPSQVEVAAQPDAQPMARPAPALVAPRPTVSRPTATPETGGDPRIALLQKMIKEHQNPGKKGPKDGGFLGMGISQDDLSQMLRQGGVAMYQAASQPGAGVGDWLGAGLVGAGKARGSSKAARKKAKGSKASELQKMQMKMAELLMSGQKDKQELAFKKAAQADRKRRTDAYVHRAFKEAKSGSGEKPVRLNDVIRLAKNKEGLVDGDILRTRRS